MQKAFAWSKWLRIGADKKLWLGLLNNKPTMLAVSALVLLLFGDTLLPFFWHIIHVFIEVIELMFEHFLEHVFGVTPRQAEFIVFWTGITAIGIIVWRLSAKVYVVIAQACETAWQGWCAKAGPTKLMAAFKVTFLLGVLGKTMLLFI